MLAITSAARGFCQNAGPRPVTPFALMRTLTHVATAGEAAADRPTFIGPKNDNLDREDSPVMQIGVNRCLTFCLDTRMRIIRYILATVRLGNCEGRFGFTSGPFQLATGAAVYSYQASKVAISFSGPYRISQVPLIS